jgi:transposase
MELPARRWPDNLAELKRIIAATALDATTAQAEIARLKFQLARYRGRAEFGRSSEKLARDTEQLELALEALETDQAERLVPASPEVAAAIETAVEAQKPAWRPLPEHLPREDLRHPAPCTCPACGGALSKIGDEVSEILDYLPGRFKVVPHIREKLSCRVCDTVVAAPAPDQAIARGRAGAELLAHIVVSKYDDHLSLYRQAEIFARDGVSLETSTLSAGSEPQRQRYSRSSTPSPLTPSPAALCTSTTRRCWSWRRAPARPRRAGCGPTSAMSGHLLARGHRRLNSFTRPIARANIRRPI